MDIPNGNSLRPRPVPEFQDVTLDCGGVSVSWIEKCEDERGYPCSFNVHGRLYRLSPGLTNAHGLSQVRVTASVMVIPASMVPLSITLDCLKKKTY